MNSSSLVVRGRESIRTTKVFDSYWWFAAERQRVFSRRLKDIRPYTENEILGRYRFTNAYRASDRVSQYLIRKVIYDGDMAPEEVFFRTILFRMFNKIETWEMLMRTLGHPTWHGFDFRAYDRVLTAAMERGQTIYSAAYIMPSRSKGYESPRKHRNHLSLIVAMMKDRAASRLMDARRAVDAFNVLCSYPMIGDFLGYQFFVDLNYGPVLSFSEMEFVVAGPGARSGIRKCFETTAGFSDADIIRLVTDAQEEHFQRRGIDFISLWGRPLQLIDCQNLFCEIDKYARVAHPEFTPDGGRSRIKQRYQPNAAPLKVWYPPKWRINERIPKGLRSM